MEEKQGLMYLPVLATRGVICFPDNELTLEVGREKSITAINISMSIDEMKIVLVSQRKPDVDNPDFDGLYKFGTLCSITSVKKNQDKSYKVFLKCLSRVSIDSFVEDECIRCNCEIVNTVFGDKNEEIALLRNLFKLLPNLAKAGISLPSQLIKQLSSETDAEHVCNVISQIVPDSFEHKQELLEIVNLNQRLEKVLDLVAQQETINKIELDIDQKIKDRMENTQKEYILREKLKTIKEELDQNGDEEDNILDDIEKNPYPQNIKDRIKEELKKLDSMPSTAPEAAVTKNYIDWLVKTPWYQKTTDEEDISKVEEVLNNDHYGLDKPKERILEYLAVKKLTSSLKAPIICFSGPPGTGKTSLALSIAKALNRKLVKVSLGGVSDESEIRGHRKTYLGSMPGRIIQGMKKAGVINPVFVLDEIDKLGRDYKGDPSNALLEVLDPEQNKMFSDNFIEETYDLSNVLFIATANYLENIPAPLLDRLEVIELSSYTEQEKLEIAKKYLIKKQVEANGISSLDLDDEAILFIIQSYTRESGVRQLERNIGTICRKIAVKSLKDDKTSHKVDIKLVKEYLGKELFDYTKKENSDQIGVVTGLAYTQYGGDILPIEVVYFEGKGNVVITGNLGDVMKESANIALGYVKANAEKYHIDPKFFESHDIHIHCPEGAVPKDGPSAGVTLTTAIVSALTKKAVRSDVAMTGEVTLRGNVLPIGGLREKSIGAHRSHIKEIFIPVENEKDIEDIPESVRKELIIHPVKHVDEIISKVIVNA